MLLFANGAEVTESYSHWDLLLEQLEHVGRTSSHYLNQHWECFVYRGLPTFTRLRLQFPQPWRDFWCTCRDGISS